jgi:hypothetical protein
MYLRFLNLATVWHLGFPYTNCYRLLMQRVPDKLEATGKATLRALKLLCVGLVLQGIRMATDLFLNWTTLQLIRQVFDFFFRNGVFPASASIDAHSRTTSVWCWLFLLLLWHTGGFFHGVRSLTFGVDVTQIRLMGILQVRDIQYIIQNRQHS